MNRLRRVRVPRYTAHQRAFSFMYVLTGLLICAEIVAAGDIIEEVILHDIFSTQLDSMATQCVQATASSFSFEFDFDAVDHTGHSWAGDSTGTTNAADYERDNFLASIHHEDANPNRTWTAGISLAGNIYSFRGPFGEASPPQTKWNPDDGGSFWVDDLVQMGVVADTRADTSPSSFCYNHPNQTLTPLNYNIECACVNASTNVVLCNATGATVSKSNIRLVNNFVHQGGVYNRDMGEDANGTPYLFKTQNGNLAGKPFFSPSIAAHCEANTCAFATWGQQAHTATPWRSAILYFSRFADCGNGVLEFSQAIYNDGGSAGALGDQIYDYGNTPWGGVRSSTLPKLLVSSKDHGLDFFDDQVAEIAGWGTATCEGSNGACTSKLCMDVTCTAGYTTFTQDIPPPPIPYDEVCIDTATGSVSRLANCTSSGLTEFSPVIDRPDPCGLGFARPTRARCRVYHPQGNTSTATDAAVIGVNLISCRQCRLIITVTRPGNGTVTEFVITDLQHFTFSGGPGYVNSFIYFDPLDLAGNANDADDTAVDAWTKNLNTLLRQGDVFNLSWDTEGGVTTDDALALTFIHGRDTRNMDAENKVIWQRNRAGISSRDYTVWTVNPVHINLAPQDTYMKQMYFSTDELTNVEATAAQWVDKTDEEFVDDPNQFNGRAIQLYPGSNGRFSAVAAAAQGETSTSCSSSATPACSGWSTPKSNHMALFYISCGNNTKLTADQYHFSPTQATFGDDLNYVDDDPIRSYVCKDDPTERPSWKLLGFFVEDSCSSIENWTYDFTVCTETSSPSYKPSEHPSADPSQSPSSMPSLSSQSSDAPSVKPSLSSQPSDMPSDEPSLSSEPSDMPSDEPSLSSQPSDAPSDGPSLSSQPSDMPSDAPSLPQVTASPSLSSSPSLRPTIVPSEPPSGPSTCGNNNKKNCQSPCVWHKRTCKESKPPSGPSTCGNNNKKNCQSPCVWHKRTCKEPDNIFAKPQP